MKKLKIMAVLLCAVLAATLTACGGSSASSEAAAPSEEEKAEEPVESEAAEADSNETEEVSEKAAEETSEEAEEETSEEAAEETAEATEIIVFAAASMQETLTEIQGLYEAANPGVKLTYNFDSSGTLKTQIEEGAPCDLFISASPKQMNQLDIEADPEVNTDGLDFVLSESRINLLENKVTLAVPDGNPKGIESFDQLAALLKDGEVLLAMGNEDVPVGQYTQKIFAYYELDQAALETAGKLTYGTNVKEVTTQVAEKSVDCGVIYATDAFSAGLTVVDSATPEMCGQVIYPAAVMKNSEVKDAAQAFLTYLTGDEAKAVFEAVGFTSLQ